ncbi:unnamed protein product [Ilex paraguariensis]|uniref:Uncharacterized protein n=1 Tax=Ilex paraguariensis TaxID=185542 RepID=A0ABC8RII8_9AQUA
MKNRGRNKLFSCFRQVADDDSSVKRNGHGGSDDQVLNYIVIGGGGNKGSVLVPKVWNSMCEEKSEESLDGDVAGAGKRSTKKRLHRSFSRVLKAVLFDTSLAMEIRNRKSRKNLFGIKSNQSSKREKISNSIKEKPTSKQSSDVNDLLRMDSSSSSLEFSSSTITSSSFSSSCTSSSITSNSRSFIANSMDIKQGYKQTSTITKKTRDCGHYFSSNIGLCLILVCLLVLIFWGRTCAILCTSTWLFFARRGINGIVSPEKEIDWEEHKKRVIMEGLLERNRSRVL